VSCCCPRTNGGQPREDCCTLADTLAAGNATDGTDIVVSVGDEITGLMSLDIGDGSDSPALTLDKADAGQSIIRFENVGIARWDVTCDGSENLTLDRRDAAGAFVDQVVASAANGVWTFPVDVAVTADVYAGDQLTVGAMSQASDGITTTKTRVATTDASNSDTVVATLSANQRSMVIRWWVTACRDTGDNFFTKVSTNVATRIGGIVTLGGPFPDDASITNGTGATLTAVLVVSGDDIILRRNGNAGENWIWNGRTVTQQGGI
jgi:hypothetical protein